MPGHKPNCEYKASLFVSLFSKPEKLLELYNAIEGTGYPPDTSVEIATLSDVLFMDRINDLAFVVGGKVVIFLEHQASINHNMPLRFLIYLGRVYLDTSYYQPFCTAYCREKYFFCDRINFTQLTQPPCIDRPCC